MPFTGPTTLLSAFKEIFILRQHGIRNPKMSFEKAVVKASTHATLSLPPSKAEGLQKDPNILLSFSVDIQLRPLLYLTHLKGVPFRIRLIPSPKGA